MAERRDAVTEALASLRLEGLKPEPAVVEFLERWARGEVSDEEFAAAERRLDTHGTLTETPPS